MSAGAHAGSGKTRRTCPNPQASSVKLRRTSFYCGFGVGLRPCRSSWWSPNLYACPPINLNPLGDRQQRSNIRDGSGLKCSPGHRHRKIPKPRKALIRRAVRSIVSSGQGAPAEVMSLHDSRLQPSIPRRPRRDRGALHRHAGSGC
jgi:hypothetical protein